MKTGTLNCFRGWYLETILSKNGRLNVNFNKNDLRTFRERILQKEKLDQKKKVSL